MMSDEVLLALSGVLLGWFLNELAGAFRVAREERHLVRQAIPPLVSLYFEKYRINEILSFFNRKMGDDFERLVQEATKDKTKAGTVGAAIDAYLNDFEDIRRHNVKMPQSNRETLINDLTNAMNRLACVDPISAYRAKRLLSEFLLFQDIEMPVQGSPPQVYVHFLGKILEVFRSDMDLLEKVIHAVAWRASLVDYCKVLRLINELERELDGGMARAHENIFKERA